MLQELVSKTFTIFLNEKNNIYICNSGSTVVCRIEKKQNYIYKFFQTFEVKANT